MWRASDFFARLRAAWVEITDGVIGGTAVSDIAAAGTQVPQLLSPGILTGGIITDNGDGTVRVTAGTGVLRAVNDPSADLLNISWSLKASQALADNSANYVYVDYNAGTPIVTAAAALPADVQRTTLLGAVYRAGIVLRIDTTIKQAVGDLPGTMLRRLYASQSFARESGGVVSEPAARRVAITAGTWWEKCNTFTTLAFDSNVADTFTVYYRAAGGWTAVAAQTTLDNLNYDDGTGVLHALTAGRYGVHWIYLGLDAGGAATVYVLYGQGDYTLAQAQDAGMPASVPAWVSLTARIVGKAIVKQAGAALYAMQSAFENTFEFAAATEHNSLADLQGGAAGEFYHATAAYAAALAGTNGAPGAGNKYVTDSDPRNSDARVASGGDADTVDGSHAAAFATSTHRHEMPWPCAARLVRTAVQGDQTDILYSSYAGTDWAADATYYRRYWTAARNLTVHGWRIDVGGTFNWNADQHAKFLLYLNDTRQDVGNEAGLGASGTVNSMIDFTNPGAGHTSQSRTFTLAVTAGQWIDVRVAITTKTGLQREIWPLGISLDVSEAQP